MTVKVWIIEHNHYPYIVAGQIVAFDSSAEARRWLNWIHGQQSESGYWDAVLYERKTAPPEQQKEGQ